METVAIPRPPRWYWIVAGVAVAWMLFGVMAWFMDLMTDEAALARMSEAQRQVYAARPQWIFLLYGVAIFSGLAGAAGLLLRKGWSTTALAVSLAAVIVQFGFLFLAMDTLRLLGPGAVVFPLVIFLVGVFLLWLSIHARNCSWLS
jgi:hypothetical protein